MTSDFVFKIVMWGFGTCITGFLFLVARMWHINNELSNKVSYQWLETHFEPQIKKELEKIERSIQRIEEAITRDSERLARIEERVNR